MMPLRLIRLHCLSYYVGSGDHQPSLVKHDTKTLVSTVRLHDGSRRPGFSHFGLIQTL